MVKINRARVRNFKSIIDSGEVNIDDKITILLGRNEQGKTNFLKALQSFKRGYNYAASDLCYLAGHESIDAARLPVVTLAFSLDRSDRDDLERFGGKLPELGEIVVTKYIDNHYEVEKPRVDDRLEQWAADIKKVYAFLSEHVSEIQDRLKPFAKIDIKKHMEWLKSMQNPDGGFGPTAGQSSDVSQSYVASAALSIMGSLDQIDKRKLVSFVVSAQHPNGGFGQFPNQQPHAQHTYSAIMLLRELKRLNRVESDKHIDWLKSLQNYDGGFGAVPKDSSSMQYTYIVIEALNALGTLNSIDKGKLIEFILSTQHPNGGFGQLPKQQPQVQFAHNAVFSLKMLGALDKIDKRNHIAWLKSLQRPDGGFSHIPGEPSHIAYTWFAVKTLVLLGGLNSIDKRKLIDFILSVQHPNGGFGQLPNQQPSVQYTLNAVSSLKELGSGMIRDFSEAVSMFSQPGNPFYMIKDSVETMISTLKFVGDQQFQPALGIIENMNRDMESHIEAMENLAGGIQSLIPSFVYFDSIEILKDSVTMNEYLRNKERYPTFSHLFELARLDIAEIRDARDPHDRKGKLKDASTAITGLVNDSWKQEEVTVSIDVDGDQILVSIEDSAGARADPPSRRSDGFRWFLSFYITFAAGTKNELKKAVLLLDNPGWLLHPSGQKDLSNTLETIAAENQIILATHSPFMIDKNKLDRIRVVERKTDEGTKILGKFYDSMYDSLSTIRAAIGATIADSLFGHKNNIIVEGYSDKIYLEAMASFLKRKNKETLNLSKLMINGAGGVDKCPYLLSWHKAEGYNVLAIVDSDDEGNHARSIMKTRDPEIDVNGDVLKLDEIDDEFKGKGLEIEDLFDESFFNKAVNRAYADILHDILGKEEIKTDEVPQEGSRIKRYQKFFKDNKLGGFDKVKVATCAAMILEKENVSLNDLPSGAINFEKLFRKIKEKLAKKGAQV